MWSVNITDQSELKLSSGNKFLDRQTGQDDYFKVPLPNEVGTYQCRSYQIWQSHVGNQVSVLHDFSRNVNRDEI